MKLEEIDLTDADYFSRTAIRIRPGPSCGPKIPCIGSENRPGRGYWSVTKYDDARLVYLNAETFSNEHGQILTFNDDDYLGNRRMMLLLDPPRHTQMRLLIAKRFTPRAVAPEEAHVREIAAKVVDAVVSKGECDFVTDVAARIPTAIICEMMGVPRADHDMMFELGSMAIGANDPEYQVDGDRRKTGDAAQQGMFHYFVKTLEAAPAQPRPGPDKRAGPRRNRGPETHRYGSAVQLFPADAWRPGNHPQYAFGWDAGADGESRAMGAGGSGRQHADADHGGGVLALDLADHPRHAHRHVRHGNSRAQNQGRRQGRDLERVGQSRRSTCFRSRSNSTSDAGPTSM